MLDLSTLKFPVTVVAQDARSGAVLMVAHADREALEETLRTGEMHYRSRTRGLWHKGATSGNTQRVVSLSADCDGDAVLARVVPAGPACHTGTVSCFGDEALMGDALGAMDATVGRRRAAMAGGGGGGGGGGAASAAATVTTLGGPPPEGEGSAGSAALPHPPVASGAISSPASASTPRPSYTQRLLADRNLRLKKLGEEAAELVTACADGDPARAAEEGVDLIYHTIVALNALGVGLDALRREAWRRRAET